MTLWGGSGVLKMGLVRPLLDLVTREGVAPLGGRGGILADVLRFPATLAPLLQLCLREDEEEEEEEGGTVAPLRGVGGREMEYDL